MTEIGQRIRMLVVVGILALMWLGLGTRLCFLHLGDNDRLLTRIQKNREVEQDHRPCSVHRVEPVCGLCAACHGRKIGARCQFVRASRQP